MPQFSSFVTLENSPGMPYHATMNIDAIILAAGLSSRMSTNKLLLPYEGKPILQHVIELVAALPFCSFTLVSRAETITQMRVPAKFRVIINPHPELGQSASLRLGLEEAQGDGFMFFQGDQPLLDEATVMAVLALSAPGVIALPSFQGVPGNPAFFPASLKTELMSATGDRGGRGVRDAHPDICRFVEVDSPAPLWDVDTPEKYQALLAKKFTSS